MYLHGDFINKTGNRVTVLILTDNDRTEEIEIGSEDSGVFFTDDPAEITAEVNDTFDHLLRQSATVRLLTRDFMPGLFRPSCRDAVVNIMRDGTCVFAGFIEPQTYSQPYNEVYDELEINCVDMLSALQYSVYGGVVSAGVRYPAVKAAAGMRTFGDILTAVLGGVSEGIGIGGGVPRILYDGSKATDSSEAARYSVFSRLSVSELLFLGDGEDDVWSLDEVVEEIMRYLGLRIAQDGMDFRIFSWETARGDSPIEWRSMTDSHTETTARVTADITADTAADCGTTVSIGEVYNQILLTCRAEEPDSLIDSPLDSELLDSPYTGRQKYLTEYSSAGEGDSAYDAFREIVTGGGTQYKGAYIREWHIQVMDNESWTFWTLVTGFRRNFIETYCADGRNQGNAANILGGNLGAGIVALGSLNRMTSGVTDSMQHRPELTEYLVVGVHGHASEPDILAAAPCAVYDGGSGGVLSPADDRITNYIVISGKVTLTPITETSGDYNELSAGRGWESVHTVEYTGDPDRRYYTRRYWEAETPETPPETDTAATGSGGLGMPAGDIPKGLHIDRERAAYVPVLACMLVVGDKCVTGGGGSFMWREYKSREECADDAEYYAQAFTVGFTVSEGYLTGEAHEISRNYDYTVNIDAADGTAIPVRKSDGVSGAVRFEILGPVNSLLLGRFSTDGVVWERLRVPEVFYSLPEKLEGEYGMPLLQAVDNIMVSKFEIKAHSDNGNVENRQTDDDVAYISDTDETFVNRKDDIEFKMCSALTREECINLGVADRISLSTVVDTETGEGVLTLYDRNRDETAKAEQLYVDSCYSEHHKPRVEMEQNITEAGAPAGMFGHYRHPAMGKEFFVLGIGRNLMEGTAALKLKETDA